METQPNSLKAVRVLLIAVGVILAVRMAVYVYTVGQPFAYYKDLGVNFITISYATHDIHTLRDALDALAWSPWYDQPLFNLNPYLSYVVAVPLAYLLGSAWFTIKIVQTLQFAAAFAAMYWACRELRFVRLWAAAAALAYAVLPATALAIRGNLDMGWTAVGAPLMLAAGLALLRRYSIYALPLVGAVCSLFGFCIAVEYLLFVSAPLYLVLSVGAYDERRKAAWIGCAAGGLIALLSTGAYFLLPSVLHSPFSDSSARVQQLVSGSILPLFSQTWDGFAGFVPRESLVSPVPVYNATSSLWFAQISGCIVAALAVAGLVWFRRRLRMGGVEWCLTILGVVLAYLTLGTYAPFGDQLWAGIGSVPFLDAIRTPDRFIVVPALVAIIWGFRSLEGLSQLRGRAAWIAPALLGVVLAGFVTFDLVEHCLENQPTMGVAEPDILHVNQLVNDAGPRTVSFALVNGGSPFDYPAYGVPTDTAPAVTDWESRYIEDGIGAVGLMQRAGVRSVISTPMWSTADAPAFPDAASIYRNLDAAQVIFQSPDGVVVSRLPSPAQTVRAVRTACYHGGPGLLDQLLAVPAFTETAFEPPVDRCSAQLHVLADYNPYDQLTPARSIAWAPGSALFPGARLQDADYPFLANRVLLKNPWYRNSVDGDALIFDSAGAALIANDASASTTFSVPARGRYDLLVRMATHSSGKWSASIDGNPPVHAAPLSPSVGMRWYRVALGTLGQGAHTLTLRIADPLEKGKIEWHGVAVDGAAIVLHTMLLQMQRTQMPLTAEAFSLDRLSTPARTPIPSVALAPASGGALPFRSAGIAGYEATEPVATLDYRYNGAEGNRVIRLSANLPKRGDIVAAALRHADGSVGPSASLAAALDDSRLTLVLNARVARGDIIHVTMYSRSIDAGWRAKFLGGTVSAGEKLALEREGPGQLRAAFNFTDVATSSPAYPWVREVSYSQQGARGGSGQRILIPLSAPEALDAIDVHAQAGGTGSARMGVSCGSAHAGRVIVSSDDVALHGANLRDCSISIQWLSGDLAFASLDVYAAYARTSGSMRIWIPSGRYAFTLRARNGRVVSGNVIHIDGAPVGKTLAFSSSGFHEVSVVSAPASDNLAILTPLDWPTHPADGLSYVRTGALRDRVSLSNTRDVEVEHLSDGNWTLKSGSRTFVGRRCDLLDTCFDRVPAGTYNLVHRYPTPLILGLVCSMLTLIVSAALLFLPLSDRQRPILRQ